MDEGQGKDVNSIKNPDRAYIAYDYSPTTFSFVTNFDYGASSSSLVINSTTNYLPGGGSGSITTVFMSSTTVISRVNYNKSQKFHTVSFDIFGTSYTSISYVDFYATAQTMP